MCCLTQAGLWLPRSVRSKRAKNTKQVKPLLLQFNSDLFSNITNICPIKQKSIHYDRPSPTVPIQPFCFLRGWKTRFHFILELFLVSHWVPEWQSTQVVKITKRHLGQLIFDYFIKVLMWVFFLVRGIVKKENRVASFDRSSRGLHRLTAPHDSLERSSQVGHHFLLLGVTVKSAGW